jgi:hypothetical protein
VIKIGKAIVPAARHMPLGQSRAFSVVLPDDLHSIKQSLFPHIQKKSLRIACELFPFISRKKDFIPVDRENMQVVYSC